MDEVHGNTSALGLGFGGELPEPVDILEIFPWIPNKQTNKSRIFFLPSGGDYKFHSICHTGKLLNEIA